MKKLQISGKEFIRFDGLRYNLTDLFRLTNLAGIRLEPWGWAQSENRTRDISRKGWFFKKSWAKGSVLIEYAHYLSPSLYRDVLRALDMDDVDKLTAVFGERKAATLDLRVKEYVDKRTAAKAERARKQNEEAIAFMRTVQPIKVADLPKTDHLERARPQPATRRNQQAEDMRRAMNTPTRSMSHSRSMGPSVTHHRSEPDYLTQALVTQSVLNDWDDSSHRSHSHSRSDDTCYTPSHSSHSSHDSHSWSGDSGGSYDSGGGGCGD
jgi:hypothetical protein